MKKFILISFVTIMFGSSLNAKNSTVQIECELKGFGVKFSYDGKLTEADPNDQLEKYRMEGPIHFEDANRPNEFRSFYSVGNFDITKGVIRFFLRPIAPQLFSIFDGINFQQYTSGHQVISISSADLTDGPNGGANGKLCLVKTDSII